jgi:signal transduction histidine kinase
MVWATSGAVLLLVLTGWLAWRIRHQSHRARRAEAERVRLTSQLQQAQRMESIGRLAGGVAHDFNNLLTVINGYAEILQADDRMSEEQRSHLLQIAQAGGQAANLTQQLLAFSRKQVIQPRPLNLNAVVEDITTMLRRLVGEDIELTTVLEPGLAPVMADPSQMHQVLMNLVINSRDAMPKGGRLRIETANVVVDARAAAAHAEASPGRHVTMSVADTGAGIDRETLGHIFEPFFTTKGKGEGTGLGLSMVYGIVTQSGGWISTVSEPGLGTTFTVYLPQVEAEAEVHPAGAAFPEQVSGSETILLVEDQPSVRRLASSVLRGCGYRLIEAENGEEALQAAADFSGTIHLLLTDVVLPGMTGKELADRLLTARAGMKVLFVSGYAEDVIAHRGVVNAGIRYLPKPYAPHVLAVKVREVLNQPEA